MFKKPTKAVITDAGFASRFLPITKTIPKAMIPIGNKPIMQLVVEECVSAGIKDIIIVATPEGKKIYEDYFLNPVKNVEALLESQGKTDRFIPVREVLDLAKVTIIEQDPTLPYGNGSPIKSAEPYLAPDEAFVALYSDDVVIGEGAISKLLADFEKHPDADAIIAVQEVEGVEIEKYASVEFAEDGETLAKLIEKPKVAEAPSQLASYGRYLLTPKIFKYLVSENTGKDAELWTADAVDRLIKDNGKVYVSQTNGKWVTTGDPKNYLIAQLAFAMADAEMADAIGKEIK